MDQFPNCPKCDSEYTYEDMGLYICPECAHEWTKLSMELEEEKSKTFDAHGNELVDGDSVTVIKDLKIKGSSSVVKQGTIVRGISIVDGSSDGHDISCRIDGLGQMKLKSEFLKKI